ncbi:MAG: hypothetical protein LBE82_03320 [Chitinophagaceae bacterium]|jgi:hypothetical protein|nr:hypothetical protein [Chitinophagaceae bacterium]
MKILASIPLLTVFLFNLVGYRFVADYLSDKYESELQAKLDMNDYNASDLISIKVPLSVPYGPNSPTFEKIEGSIEIDGISYQYVERRFYQDSLEVLCIPNRAKTNIRNARDAFAQLANDFINFSSKKNPVQHKAVKYSVDDFTNDNAFAQYHELLSIFSKRTLLLNTNFRNQNFVPAIEHPPAV